MAGHIPGSAVVNAFQLSPSERKLELNIDGCFCIVRQLVVIMELNLVLTELQQIPVIVVTGLAPVIVNLHGILVVAEIFHFHLREFAGTEREHTRSDLVAERFSDLRDTERKLHTGRNTDQMKIHKNRLTGLGTEIGDMIIVKHGTDIGFHHQIEFTRRGEIGRTAVRADFRVRHLIDAVARLAVLAVAHDIAETVDMAGSLPDFRMADHRGIKPDDIIALFNHFAPPELFYRFFHRGSVRTVIPETVETAVNLRTLKHKTAALAQRHDLIHQLAFRGDSHKKTPSK